MKLWSWVLYIIYICKNIFDTCVFMIFPHSLFRYNAYVQELTRILQNAEAGYELIPAKLSQVKRKQAGLRRKDFTGDCPEKLQTF